MKGFWEEMLLESGQVDGSTWDSREDIVSVQPRADVISAVLLLHFLNEVVLQNLIDGDSARSFPVNTTKSLGGFFESSAEL